MEDEEIVSGGGHGGDGKGRRRWLGTEEGEDKEKDKIRKIMAEGEKREHSGIRKESGRGGLNNKRAYRDGILEQKHSIL